MTDADWLRAVAAAPDDPVVRLLYADWLDDRGDPRGEHLRLDVELARLADGDPLAAPLRARLIELLPGTDARWRAKVCRVPVEAGEPFAHPRRFPLNVPGPWYTCGDCMSCEAPEAEAPDLLAPLTAENNRTFFVRQPVTRGEVERACWAARVCCAADLRYGGTDPVVIALLDGDPRVCDHQLPADGPTVRPAPPVNPPAADPPLCQMVLFPETAPVPLPDDIRRRLAWIPVVLASAGMLGAAVALVAVVVHRLTP